MHQFGGQFLSPFAGADSVVLVSVEPMHQSFKLSLRRVEPILRQDLAQLVGAEEPISISVHKVECAPLVEVGPSCELLSEQLHLSFTFEEGAEECLELDPGVDVEVAGVFNPSPEVKFGAVGNEARVLAAEGKNPLTKLVKVNSAAATSIVSLEEQKDVVRHEICKAQRVAQSFLQVVSADVAVGPGVKHPEGVQQVEIRFQCEVNFS